MREFIVYCWTHKESGKQYVGATSRGPSIRLKGHLKATTYFGNALRKHGIEAFTFEILCVEDTRVKMFEKEIFYIAELNTVYPDGYNIEKGGGSEPVYGKGMCSEITRKALSFANKGYANTPEHNEKIATAHTGKKHSLEHNLKSAHGQSKITRDDVVYIRSQPEKSCHELAKELNMNWYNVYRVQKYKTFKDG